MTLTHHHPRLHFHLRRLRPARDRPPGVVALVLIGVVTVAVIVMYLTGAQVVLICLAGS